MVIVYPHIGDPTDYYIPLKKIRKIRRTTKEFNGQFRTVISVYFVEGYYDQWGWKDRVISFSLIDSDDTF